MIIVKIQGGLGNQISQYAFSRLLAEIYTGQEIKFDLNWFLYNPFDYRELELARAFNSGKLVYSVAKNIEIIKATKRIPMKTMNQALPVRAFNKISKILQNTFKCNRVIEQTIESGYPINENIEDCNCKKNWYFNGFWHNYDYSSIMPQLRNELEFNPINMECNQPIIDAIEKTNSISVHIRRGDYTSSVYDVTTENYYVNAVNVIKEKLEACGDMKFFIFSDDCEVAQEWFKKIDVDYQIVNVNKGEASYMDMYLMSLCKHNIITNSSFSYWAAQLNKNPLKIVIHPRLQRKNEETWKVPGWIMLDN